MDFFATKRKKLLVFLTICILVISYSYFRTMMVVPGRITLFEGEEHTYNFKSPFLVKVKADQNDVIQLNNKAIKTGWSNLKLSRPVSLKSQKNGSVSLNMKLFGLIPFKTVQVDIVPNKKLVACGNTVGVKIRIDGILVIGVSEVEGRNGQKLMPIRDSGIKPGDFLVEANDKKLSDIEELINEINKGKGKELKIKYRRGSNYKDASVIPVLAADDNKYHVGLWVRDSTAGIGTLTFYDPDNKSFGALGHGITDIDTGTLMPVDSGEILESNILAVKKGQQGNPGELKGVFLEDRNKLGTIINNCSYGIYGTLKDEAIERISNKLYPIALRNQVREGPAQILSNIDGKRIEAFDIEIQKVTRHSSSGSKGMVIKITDSRLLDATGGIVQGMSGSPIIQDGRLIGAVTHVLVNDPTRGYGIFIEWMIKNEISQKDNATRKVS